VVFGHAVETVFFVSLSHITRMIIMIVHISINVTTQAMIMLIGMSSSAAELRNKRKCWFSRILDNVSQWNGMSIPALLIQ
jgi:hypothetical protein